MPDAKWNNEREIHFRMNSDALWSVRKNIIIIVIIGIGICKWNIHLDDAREVRGMRMWGQDEYKHLDKTEQNRLKWDNRFRESFVSSLRRPLLNETVCVFVFLSVPLLLLLYMMAENVDGDIQRLLYKYNNIDVIYFRCVDIKLSGIIDLHIHTVVYVCGTIERRDRYIYRFFFHLKSINIHGFKMDDH